MTYDSLHYAVNRSLGACVRSAFLQLTGYFHRKGAHPNFENMHSSLGGLKTAGGVAPRFGLDGARLIEDVQRSFMTGFCNSMRVAVLALLLGTLFVLWRSRKQVSAPTDEP